MYRLPCNVLVVAALCASSAAFAQAPKIGAAGAPVKAQDRADELFEQGAAAYHAGRLSEAEGKLGQAWAIKKTHDIAGDLGVVEFKLGKFVLAAEHLAWALQHFPPTESDQARRAFQETLAKTRPQVATLRIRVDIDGADVTVNGRAVGTTPIADEVFVEPGTVTLVARRDGYEATQQAVPVAKGDTRDVTLTLQPVRDNSKRRSAVPGGVLAGVAGAALVTGVTLLVVQRSKGTSAQNLHDAILAAGHTCVTGAGNYDSRCADVYNDASMGNTLQKAGVGLLVGAGAAAVGTAIYFLVPQVSSPARSGALYVMPALSPTTVGLTLAGTF